MEVTQSNFSRILPEVEKAIKECSFLSIDCELTGLKTALNSINAFDSPKQYYEKVLKDCKEFLVIQYGISLFRYEEKQNTFKHQSYNFYIFRRALHKYVPDQRFLCQTSSVDFLIGHGFDFNKLFKDGIPYLNDSEENKCREVLAEQQKRRLDFINSAVSENNDIIPIPENAQKFVDDVVGKLEEFLKTDESELQLPKCNAFFRRLIYQISAEKFLNKISLDTRVVGTDRVLFATKSRTREDRMEDQKQKYEDILKDLEEYVGFSKVIRMIVQSGKLVVGHNFMLDFLHTIDKFLTPLPNDYMEFKECAGSLFPKILDTKYLASTMPFKTHINSTILKRLLDVLVEPPFGIPQIEIEDGCMGYDINDVKEHEAGYDSFITGLCFLAMWKHLGFLRDWPEEDRFGKLGFKLLDPYLNKIFLMFLADNQYLHVAGDDLNPSREHVFHLTFPKEWKTDNIIQLFSPFGAVQVAWLSDTSAYVGLYKKEHAALALKTLSQSETYTIMTFAKRQYQLAGIKTPCPSPLKTRKSSEGKPSRIKRRKTDSFDGSFPKMKRSIEPIEEEDDTSTSEIEVSSSAEEKTSPESTTKGDKQEPPIKKSKTFVECESWD